MSPTSNVLILTEHVYAVVRSMFPQDTDRVAVKLQDGGVLLTSADGDHVQVLVQSVHFLPGEPLPF